MARLKKVGALSIGAGRPCPRSRVPRVNVGAQRARAPFSGDGSFTALRPTRGAVPVHVIDVERAKPGVLPKVAPRLGKEYRLMSGSANWRGRGRDRLKRDIPMSVRRGNLVSTSRSGHCVGHSALTALEMARQARKLPDVDRLLVCVCSREDFRALRCPAATRSNQARGSQPHKAAQSASPTDRASRPPASLGG